MATVRALYIFSHFLFLSNFWICKKKNDGNFVATAAVDKNYSVFSEIKEICFLDFIHLNPVM